jgi:hypothetical protein
VNREDRFGQYRRSRQEGKRLAITRKARLTTDILRRHFSGKAVLGLLTTDSEGRCRWAVIDIDRHGDEGSAVANEKAAIALYDRGTQLGCQCILEDSNGRGGFHLWLLFNGPVPAARLYPFAKGLVHDWHDLGLQAEPEVFPKQGTLKAGRTGNWVRIPGHHHSLPHWSRIWDGGRWLAGEEAVKTLLNTRGGKHTTLPDGTQEFATEEVADLTRVGDDHQAEPRLLCLARSAIGVLPSKFADEYDKWLIVGMSLKSLGDEGLVLWDQWSRRSPKYQDGMALFCATIVHTTSYKVPLGSGRVGSSRAEVFGGSRRVSPLCAPFFAPRPWPARTPTTVCRSR